jgi:hypothetical protein
VKHQPKWKAKIANSSTTDLRVSSSDRSDEEVTHPMGWDRAKVVAQKGKRKGKEGSISQSEYSSVVDGMMFTLKKLITSFANVQL